MKKVLVLIAALTIAVGASADTWPGTFPYDTIITGDRAGLPMPAHHLHLHADMFYYGMLNKEFTEDDSVDDTLKNSIMGVPFGFGYTFNGLWEIDFAAQMLRTTTESAVAGDDDEVEMGLGDASVKIRGLFRVGDGFYLGPRVATKVPGGNANIGLGDGQIDIDAGVVFAKFGGMLGVNGQVGGRYRLEQEDSHRKPGIQIYANVEPGIALNEKFVIGVPIGFDYHMESELMNNDVNSQYYEQYFSEDNAGYALAVGLKPTFIINDKHSVNAAVSYPVIGKHANQELLVSVGIDSFIPMPKPNKDRDNDGILNNVDAAPDDPEDFDGFEDEDGRPDKDNDNDGIDDVDDDCPNEAENFNDFEDEDGCPDVKPEPVVEERIILEGLHFVPNSDELTAGSYPSLEKAGKTMQDNPNMKVTIEGHTAAIGRPDFEQELSETRAGRVMKELVGKYGIDASRLSHVGYGSTKPIADNSTEEGKKKNRRIEFVTK